MKQDLKLELDRLLPRGKNKNIVGLMKYKSGRQMRKEFFGLRACTYSYLKVNNDEDKKTRDTKNDAIKRKLKLQDYKLKKKK